MPTMNDEALAQDRSARFACRKIHVPIEIDWSKEELFRTSKSIAGTLSRRQAWWSDYFNGEPDKNRFESVISAKKGLYLQTLRRHEREHPQILEKILGKIVSPSEGKFAALASAYADQGVLVYVPKNLQLELPLHSMLWGPGINLAYLSHILVWLDEDSP